MAFMGILMGYAGTWDRAVELTTTAMKCNPHHPGWYRFATYYDAYRQKDYATALSVAQKMNLPDYFPTHYVLAMAHAQLGNENAAYAAAERTREIWPEFEDQGYVRHFKKWIFAQPALLEHIMEGLALAGFRLRRPGSSGTDGSMG